MTKKEFKVDFMCVGAAKCGTTWLFNILNQHPDVLIPDCKEIHYFNQFHPETLKPNLNFQQDTTWYHAHYKNALSTQLKGDFSTTYFREIETASRLYNYNPDLKIIVILRNPIERAWSHFQFLYTRGFLKDKDFFKAVKEVPSILTAGEYSQMLTSYAEYFTSEQMKVILFEEFKKPNELKKSIIEFLNLQNFKPEGLYERVNITEEVINETAHKIVTDFKQSIIGQKVNRSFISKTFINFFTKNSRTPIHKEVIPSDVHSFLKRHYQKDLAAIRDIEIPTNWF